MAKAKRDPTTAKEIKRLRDAILSNESKEGQIHIGIAAYERLSVLLRKEKNFKGEIKLLERYAKQFERDYHADARRDSSPHLALLERLAKAKALLNTKDGTCEVCNKGPQQITLREGGRWICSSCHKKLLPPQRPKHLASEREIKAIRESGFEIADDTTKEEAERIATLHASVCYYVYDVWETLTGTRPVSIVGHEAIDSFATLLFHDWEMVQRLVAEQNQREQFAYSRMTEGELNDPFRYQHLAKTKPPLVQGEDFQTVAAKLREHFPEYVKPPPVDEVEDMWAFLD